jgi:hypothetical protein
MKSQAFVEQNCTVKHEGQSFMSGGAYLLNCMDGIARGIVHADPSKGIVTTWHGKQIARAAFGPVYRGNFCRMQSVSFDFQGVRFTGRYCPDWASAVKVHSTKVARLAS